MAKRKYTETVECADTNCNETITYEFANKTDSLRSSRAIEGWRCERHSGAWLWPGQSRSGEFVIECIPAHNGQPVWDHGGTVITNLYTPIDYAARSDNFPVGTRLVVRMSVEVVNAER